MSITATVEKPASPAGSGGYSGDNYYDDYDEEPPVDSTETPVGSFLDGISADAWYYDSVKWKGEFFDPASPVTRAGAITMLDRCARTKGEGFKGMWAFPLPFPDTAEVSDYACEPLCWPTMNGIISAVTTAGFLPATMPQQRRSPLCSCALTR